MSPRHALSIFIAVVAGLTGGCAREQPERQPRVDQAATSTRSADPGDPEGILAAAREGTKIALEKAAELQALRSKQVERLERKVERIQQLLDAGNLDEAEVLLVDLHWIPVEPGKRGEADLSRVYDDKRTALARFLESRRQRVP